MKTVGMFPAWAGVAAANAGRPRQGTVQSPRLRRINKSAAAKPLRHRPEFLTGRPPRFALWAREQYTR